MVNDNDFNKKHFCSSVKGISRKLKSCRKMKLHFSHLLWACSNCATGEVFNHAPLLAFGCSLPIWVGRIRIIGSLTKVMYIISPSQINTRNTATATEPLYNQGPVQALRLIQDQVDRLNYPKETFFPPKERAKALQLLEDFLELSHVQTTEPAHTTLVPQGPWHLKS